MKKMYVGVGIMFSIVAISQFETLMIFMLSGSIPETAIAIPASTMMAVSLAGLVSIAVVSRYHTRVYRFAQHLYDTFEAKKVVEASPAAPKKAHSTSDRLPKRRLGNI